MASSETLTVSLPSDLAVALRAAVEAGEYPDVDAALADALAAWARREEDAAEELAWVKAKVRAALHDPRPPLSMAEVRAHMEEVFRRSKAEDDAAA